MATIVVAGGGLAGLACAWRLRRAGHTVRLLERGPGIGGRARTEEHDGLLLEAGCPVVTRGQRRVMALAAETGLEGELRALPPGRDARWQGGRLVGAAPRDGLAVVTALRRDPDARRAVRAVADLHRAARAFDPPARVSPERAERDAAADALGWWPASPDARGERHRFPLRAALSLAAPHTFRGGIGRLAEALAQGLDVVTGCDVRRIDTDASGASLSLRVDGDERSEHADAVVVAVPATRVGALCPKLTPAERDFFEGTRFESGIVVQLLFARAPRLPWRSVVFDAASGLELASLVSLPARGTGAPSTTAPATGGAGVLRATLAASAVARMHRVSDASVADLVLENLAYSELGAVRPDGFAVFRHPDLVPRFDAGHVGRLVRFASRLERSPRVAFAGDALAGPGIDGAVASGLRAAREITGLV